MINHMRREAIRKEYEMDKNKANLMAIKQEKIKRLAEIEGKFTANEKNNVDFSRLIF